MNGKASWLRVSWMAAALVPFLAGFAGAVNPIAAQANHPIPQNQPMATSPSPGQTATSQFHFEKAKDLIGAKVVNDKGEQLGTVADIVLTPGRDAVNYVVLSHSGTFGTAGKYFAVPWSQFKLQPGEEGRVLVLSNVNKADLDQAPGFDKNHWPATASENWLGMQRPGSMAPSGTPAPRLIVNQGSSEATNKPAYPGSTSANAAPFSIDQLRLSKLLGTTVQNPQGQDLGKLSDVMIDTNQGKLAFGVVALRSGFLGLNKDYAAVPWTAIDLTSQPGIAKLNADKQTLMASAFSRDSFPNLDNPRYASDLYARFHATPYWEEGQNLGYVPGQENPNANPPAYQTPAPNSSGMAAPNTGANAAVPEKIAHHMDRHMGKRALGYNPSTVQTVQGTVRNVRTYDIPGTSVAGVLLHVRANDGRMLWVQVAPRPFVESQNLRFHRGQPVTITGSVVQTGRHETIVASQIRLPNRTVDLRTPEGRPLWNTERYGGRAYGYVSPHSYSYGYGSPSRY